LNSTLTYTTAFAQTQTITLPDKSVVTLNANSTLKFSRNWSDKHREVWLQGEAFFNVTNKQDGKTKFTVHTTSLDIEVLGTSFNVNNRRRNTTVVLNSGKVKLKTGQIDNTDSLIMVPGEQVVFSEEKFAFTRKNVNPENFSSWIHQKLIFENTPLSQIAHLLEDNYGFQVRFGQPDMAQRKFTATIPAGNINTLLTAISESFNIGISRQGKELLFK
jgi:ferric-dicitrate binding protein FerR (iron transport regulator)